MRCSKRCPALPGELGIYLHNRNQARRQIDRNVHGRFVNSVASVLGRLPMAAIGHHGDLQVVSDADDVFGIVSAK